MERYFENLKKHREYLLKISSEVYGTVYVPQKIKGEFKKAFIGITGEVKTCTSCHLGWLNRLAKMYFDHEKKLQKTKN